MNNAEYIAQTEQFVREQLASTDKYVDALQASGDAKLIGHAEREVARTRRRVERHLAALPGKLEAADALMKLRLDDFIAEIERNLASSSAAEQ